MDIDRIVNAWRSEEYRERLSADAQAKLPESPVGEIDLTDLELTDVNGGVPESTPIITGVVSGIVSATISVASNWCVSYFDGGSCTMQTSGCC